MEASLAKHVPVVKELLAREDLNINVGSPLYRLADKDENVPVMRLLMSRNDTDVNQRGGSGPSTPFLQAITKKAWKVVDFLLESEDLDVNYGTPLYFLAQSEENLKLVSRLLARSGTHVNQRTSHNGQTALFRAIVKRNWNMTELLSSHPKIDLNVQDSKGETFLLYISRFNRNGKYDRAIRWALEASISIID